MGLAADIGQLFGLGIDIDHFDLVDDPIAPCEQAFRLVGLEFFMEKRAVYRTSEGQRPAERQVQSICTPHEGGLASVADAFPKLPEGSQA